LEIITGIALLKAALADMVTAGSVALAAKASANAALQKSLTDKVLLEQAVLQQNVATLQQQLLLSQTATQTLENVLHFGSYPVPVSRPPLPRVQAFSGPPSLDTSSAPTASNLVHALASLAQQAVIGGGTPPDASAASLPLSPPSPSSSGAEELAIARTVAACAVTLLLLAHL
jgi:hypothetical protein